MTGKNQPHFGKVTLGERAGKMSGRKVKWDHKHSFGLKYGKEGLTGQGRKGKPHICLFKFWATAYVCLYGKMTIQEKAKHKPMKTTRFRTRAHSSAGTQDIIWKGLTTVITSDYVTKTSFLYSRWDIKNMALKWTKARVEYDLQSQQVELQRKMAMILQQ